MRRFALLYAQRWRRDILQLTLWIGGTVALALASRSGVSETFGTEQDRASLLAAALANPVILLFRGLPSGIDEGAFLAFLILPFLALLAALMSTFLAVRHTRMDEELQRSEPVASTPAGRMLPLAVALVHGAAANVVLAALVTAGFVVVGGERAGGAVTMGLASGATGLTFLAVALLAAQLVRTSRAANAISVWAVMLCFLACGIGNALGTPSENLQSTRSAPLAWITPFGWAENTRPWDADDLRPLLLSLAVVLVCGAVAFALQSVRDLGGSLLPERIGRAAARAALRAPVSLVWRESRGALAGWAIGGLIAGALSTRLTGVIADIGTDIPSFQQLVQALAAEGSLAQGAVVIFFTMVGVLAACAAVQTVCRARQDEARGTAEPVLSCAVGRVRWLAAYLVVAFAGIVATVAAAVGGAAVGLASLSEPDWSLLGDAAVTGAGQIAAATVFLVLTAVVFVLAPRLVLADGWTLVVVVGMIVGLFGALFGFPDAVVDLSPFAVSPTVDAGGVDVRGLGWLVLAGALGLAVSLALMRRRELAAPD